MTPRLKLGLAAGFAALATLAIIGWARTPSPASAYNTPAPAYTTPAGYAMDPNSAARTYDDRQTANTVSYAATDPCLQPQAIGSADRYHEGYVYPAYTTRYSVRTVRPRVVERAAPVYEERRVRRNRRSTGKSVAIVGGSAGVGAAIGG